MSAGNDWALPGSAPLAMIAKSNGVFYCAGGIQVFVPIVPIIHPARITLRPISAPESLLNDASAQPAGALAQVALTRNGQRWVFRYHAGDEPSVLRCITSAAADPLRGLDWADAAALARQMGRRLGESLKEPS